eukprot:gene10035-11102_t
MATFGFGSAKPAGSTTFGSTTGTGFGSPAPAVGGTTFGASSAFGAPSGTTSAFGTTPSVGGFGSNPSGTTTGGFGTTSAFGSTTGTTATAPAFGASTTTPSFGLGGTNTAPAFGSTSTTTTGFGSPSAFGSNTTGGNAFGAPSSGSAFGSSTTTGAAPTFGGFGTPAATTTTGTTGGFGGFGSLGGGAFGASNTAAKPATTGFGTTGFGTTSGLSGFGTGTTTGGGFGTTAPTTSFGTTGFGTTGFGATSTLGTTSSLSFGGMGGAKPAVLEEKIPLETKYSDLPQPYRDEIDRTFREFKEPMRNTLAAIKSRVENKAAHELHDTLQILHLQVVKLETYQSNLKETIKPFLDEMKTLHREYRIASSNGLNQIRNRGGGISGGRTVLLDEILPNRFYTLSLEKLEKRLEESISTVANLERFVSARLRSQQESSSSVIHLRPRANIPPSNTKIGPAQLLTLIKQQAEIFGQIAADVQVIHQMAEEMRSEYLRRRAARGGDVALEPSPFELADRKEAAEKKQAEQRIKSESERYYLQQASNTPAVSTSATGSATTAPNSLGFSGFGQPAATTGTALPAAGTATTGFGFGAGLTGNTSTGATAPATTTTGFGFGTTPAAAPTNGTNPAAGTSTLGGFGTGGGLSFGAPAAPAATTPGFGLSVSTTAAPPAFGSFGAAASSNAPAAPGGFGSFGSLGAGSVRPGAPLGGGSNKSKSKRK